MTPISEEEENEAEEDTTDEEEKEDKNKSKDKQEEETEEENEREVMNARLFVPRHPGYNHSSPPPIGSSSQLSFQGTDNTHRRHTEI